MGQHLGHLDFEKGFGFAKGTLAKGILAHSGFSGSVKHRGFAKKDFCY